MSRQEQTAGWTACNPCRNKKLLCQKTTATGCSQKHLGQHLPLSSADYVVEFLID